MVFDSVMMMMSGVGLDDLRGPFKLYNSGFDDDVDVVLKMTSC